MTQLKSMLAHLAKGTRQLGTGTDFLARLWLRIQSCPITVRAIVLFSLLLALKGWLLVDLSSHLYETHWRLLPHLTEPIDLLNLGCFAGLVLATVTILGRQMAGARPWTIRGANLGLGFAALLFAVLNFKRVNSNYLYPVMDGFLDWADVGHYLTQDLFFESPYLFVYLFAYGLWYWIGARRGREHWSLYGLGVLSVLYLLVNLRDLMELNLALRVVNCLGLAGLLSWSVRRRPLGWGWSLLPVAMILLGWGLLARNGVALQNLEPYLVNFLALIGALAALAYVLGRRSPASVGLSHFLPFYMMVFLLLANRNYPRGGNYTYVMAYSLALPHYFWQETVMVLWLWLGFARVYRRHPRLARWGFNAMALGALAIALVDLNVTRKMGIRLDWHVLAMNTDPVLLWRTIAPLVGPLIAAMVLIIGLYTGLLRALQYWPRRKAVSDSMPAPGGALYGALALGLLALATPLLSKTDKGEGLGVAHILASSPWLENTRIRNYTAQEFDQVSARLGLRNPDRRVHQPPTGAPAELNVLLILMESSYNRYLSLFGAADETQPLLKKVSGSHGIVPQLLRELAVLDQRPLYRV